jgi:glucose/arabinose dehydrogenase
MTVCAHAQTMFFDDYRPAPAYSWQTRAALADQSPRLDVTELSSELQGPYGIAFLPDGRAIISEMAGRIRIMDSEGNVSAPVQGLPEVWSSSPGAGMRDLALDPDFATNRLIYFVYAAMPEGDLEGLDNEQRGEFSKRYTARARLSADYSRMSDVEHLIEAAARRLVFADDGTLFLTTDAATAIRDRAQDMAMLEGKVLRINPDGSIPEDNPYVGRNGVHPAIYAAGLRDPSGAAFHPTTGELWTVEHGPRGGDELNIIRPGSNYGWPVISYGRDYTRAPIGEGMTAREGMEQPVYFWTPSIAPGSLMFYTGDAIERWKGNALVSTLSGEHISRLVLDGERVVAEERLMHGRGQRIRTLAQAPDGSVYMLTNAMPGPPSAATGASYVYRITVRTVQNPFGALEEE